MPRNIDRERWEAYLMMVLLATRPFLFLGAVVLLLYAIAAFSAYALIGVIALGFSVFLFLMVFYDQASLLIARLGAWLITIRNK